MEWLGWIGIVVGLFALLVGWDLIFCGGRRCAKIADHMPIRFPPARLMRVRGPGDDDSALPRARPR